MSFSDLIKNSVIESYGSIDIGVPEILVSLAVALIISVYIFFCYRIMTRRTFYSKSFNLSLIALCLITTAIILTIQSSLVVSLGMVGALSIVRFRTAIKEPMDLVFLFWSISVGIICGAGLFTIAVITSLLLTVSIYIFDRIPIGRAPMILTVSFMNSRKLDDHINEIIREHTGHYTVKSRVVTGDTVNLVCELRTADDTDLAYSLSELEGVNSASVLSHDGEVTF